MFRFGSTLFALLLVSFFSFNAQSRTFKNAYISFEMQDNWKCGLEQTEWVCRAEDPQEGKEAVIILTAKEKGPTDTFPQYETHMNNSINTITRNGLSLVSTVKYKAQTTNINGLPWLDGLHADSEVQNYFTRYMATIKDQIAILVTFNAHNKLYAKHSANFNKTIQSLKVVATKDLLSRPETGPLRTGEMFGPNGATGGSGTSDLLASEEPTASGKKGIFGNKMLLGLGVLILAVLIYIVAKVYSKK